MVITTDGQWAVLGSLSEIQGISQNGTIGRIKPPGDSTPSRHGLASKGQGHQEPPLLPCLLSCFPGIQEFCSLRQPKGENLVGS